MPKNVRWPDDAAGDGEASDSGVAMNPLRFLLLPCAVLAMSADASASAQARPALLGPHRSSLVNVIDRELLLKRGQGDAIQMFTWKTGPRSNIVGQHGSSRTGYNLPANPKTEFEGWRRSVRHALLARRRFHDERATPLLGYRSAISLPSRISRKLLMAHAIARLDGVSPYQLLAPAGAVVRQEKRSSVQGSAVLL